MDILVVDDERSIREATSIAVEAEGHYAETADSGTVALLKLKEEHFDLVLLDMRLGDEDGLEILDNIRKRYPDVPVVVFTAHASIKNAVEATRRGALDYLEKPFSPDQLRYVLVRAQKTRQMEQRIEELETEVLAQSPEPVFESEDRAMKEALDILFRAADTPASILILGESGTGKSVLARAVHTQSQVRSRPFVTISCPSLSRELLESELFGHVKGAFTGAVADKWGKVRAAEGGTLFLDEIGELPLEIQPKLLRLLQEREYERVGENKTRTASVRVIAATNRNLRELVAKGSFREDLYYRLNVIAVEVPPLRNRPADLVRFASSYLQFFSRQVGGRVKRFSSDALESIRVYPWPGNLRELRNAVERAVILSRGVEVTAADLPESVDRHRASPPAPDPDSKNGSPPAALEPAADGVSVGSPVSLEDLEREHIRRIIDSAPSMQKAAALLGIDQATLYRKRKKMGLK